MVEPIGIENAFDGFDIESAETKSATDGAFEGGHRVALEHLVENATSSGEVIGMVIQDLSHQLGAVFEARVELSDISCALFPGTRLGPRVMSRVGDPLADAGGDAGMGGDEIGAYEDAKMRLIGMNKGGFAEEASRHRVAITFEIDETFDGHLSGRDLGEIDGMIGKREEMGALERETIDGALFGGAMNAGIHFVEPGRELTVEIFEIAELTSGKKVGLDIVEKPLLFSLSVRVPNLVRKPHESECAAKLGHLRVDLGLAPCAGMNRETRIVDDHEFGRPAEIFERGIRAPLHVDATESEVEVAEDMAAKAEDDGVEDDFGTLAAELHMIF